MNMLSHPTWKHFGCCCTMGSDMFHGKNDASVPFEWDDKFGSQVQDLFLLLLLQVILRAGML